MSSAEPRPRAFDVEYNGQTIRFDLNPFDESPAPGDDVYYFTCPRCAEGLNGISDTSAGWTITFDSQGRATVRPSILCRSRRDGTECGWHVFITDGVAKDCA